MRWLVIIEKKVITQRVAVRCIAWLDSHRFHPPTLDNPRYESLARTTDTTKLSAVENIRYIQNDTRSVGTAFIHPKMNIDATDAQNRTIAKITRPTRMLIEQRIGSIECIC